VTTSNLLTRLFTPVERWLKEWSPIYFRKLFVGALPPDATKEEVQSYFQKFGPVEMCTIKTDVYTGRSRGFGFVIMQNEDAVQKVHPLQIKSVD